MRTYITVQGDKWDSIAHNQMGDVKYASVLMKANIAHRDIYVFPSGIELSIPDVDENVSNNILPPWKRVSG